MCKAFSVSAPGSTRVEQRRILTIAGPRLESSPTLNDCPHALADDIVIILD
jgi:hypothetical protein